MPPNIGSPGTPGSLNAGATSFAFQPARPNAGIQLAKPASKALQIKKPPPKEPKATTPSSTPATPVPAEGEKDKAATPEATTTSSTPAPKSEDKASSAEAEKAEADKKAKEEADKAAASEKAAAEKAAAAEAKAAADKEAQEKAAREKEAKEKEELAEKIRLQEEEAKRIREAKEAEEKAAKEKEEAERKKKEEEDAAVAAAKAEEKRQAAAATAAAAAAAAASAEAEKKLDEAAAATTTPSDAKPAATEEDKSASTTSAAAESADTAAPSAAKKATPEPLDLKSTSSPAPVSQESIVAPGKSLSSARRIEDLSVVSYPENIKSPNPDLNASARPGKFRYDREFLLQFMEICKSKPEQLPSLEALGMTDEGPGPGPSVSRTVSHGGRARIPSVPSTPSGSRMGIPPPNARSVSGFAGTMGQFSAGGGVPLTSAERFAQSTQGGQGRGQMARTPSMTGGMGGIPMGGSSGRGMDRNSQRGSRRPNPRNAPPASTMLPSDVAPLEVSENRWTPSVQASSSGRGGAAQSEDSPDVVERKVKALLNKLTIENFDSISKQILDWADKSAKETDGRILKQVIALIFEKATDEQTWSAVYARLCLFLAAKVSNDVADHSLKEATGQPTSGGKLFRRYLLTRCQADYERGWAQKESATAAAKGKAADDQAKRAAAEKEAEEAGVDKETAAKGVDFSEEYYAAEKAKRRGLGLVRFIGELFKLGMLREKIMHECIKKLIDNVENPEEEDIESLCRLLKTVGKQLEEGKDPANAKYMAIYFMRLQMIVDNKAVSSRLQFMILDLVDIRKNGWQTKEALAGPKTIAEIHEDSQRQKEEEARRTTSAGRGLPPRMGMERGGSRRGQGRDGPVGPDGWQSAPVAPRPQKAGDLASLGKIRSGTGGSPALLAGFGRQSKQAAKEESPSTGGAVNPFALLAGGDEAGTSELSPPATDAPQRTPLKLAPRTVDAPTADKAQAASGEGEEESEEGEIQEGGEMDEATKRSIDNSVKEFLGVRDIPEGKATFEALPKAHRGELAKAFIAKVVDGKQQDVKSVTELFKAVADEDDLVPSTSFRDAFIPTVTDLEDIATDAPKAFENIAGLMVAAQLSEADVQHLQEQMVSNEEDLEGIQKRLMDVFTAASS